MRIIHVALNAPGSPQHGLKRALASLGEVREIDWMENQRRGVSTGRQLVEMAQEFQPDLVFMQLQTEGVISTGDLRELQHLRPKPCVISWSGDVRHPTPQHYFDTGRVIDLTLFTNLNDVDRLLDSGVSSDHLQIGFDEQTFSPLGPLGPSRMPIVFLGGNYTNRFPLSEHRSAMVEALRHRFGSQFKVYGGNWLFRTESLNESDEAACYRGCSIAIHQSHYSYGRYFSDRLLRAMGSGAFVLAHRWPGMELDFVDGQHLVGWDTFKELTEKAQHYLAADDERKRIAAAGCELVHRDHTWLARMPRLLELAGLSKGVGC